MGITLESLDQLHLKRTPDVTFYKVESYYCHRLQQEFWGSMSKLINFGRLMPNYIKVTQDS